MSDLFVVSNPVKDLLLSDSRVLSLICLGKGVYFGWLVGWLVGWFWGSLTCVESVILPLLVSPLNIRLMYKTILCHLKYEADV